jgi:peroxiredoxin Q/BCP
METLTRWLTTSSFAILTMLAGPSQAYLGSGESAPNFTLATFLGGETNIVTLSDALVQGPVVLYFFPLNYSYSCSAEAQQLDYAANEFDGFNATVIGISSQNMDTIRENSNADCLNNFPIAADPDLDIISAYDAVINYDDDQSQRIAYVISPNGEIILVHRSSDPLGYIKESIDAVQEWKMVNDVETY